MLDRAFERDIIRMTWQYGLALAPWNVFAGGKIRNDAGEANTSRDDEETAMLKALQKVAAEVRVKSVRSVAIAYLIQQMTYVFPTVTVSGLDVGLFEEYLDALRVSLTEQQIELIESAKPLELGFPHTFIGDGGKHNGRLADINLGAEDH